VEAEVTTKELEAMIAAKFSPPAYATLFEVANGTAGSISRRADAISMGLWPSRGRELHGFEIKASRSDWLRELESPEKADAICRYCDRWWIVTNAGVVREGELPTTWGLLVGKPNGLVTEVQAPALNPIQMDRVFLAALMRRAVEQSVDAKTIEAAKAEARQETDKRWQVITASRDKEIGELRKLIDEFQDASGVRINGWDGAVKIGEAVKALLNKKPDFCIQEALKFAERATSALKEMLAICGGND